MPRKTRLDKQKYLRMDKLETIDTPFDTNETDSLERIVKVSSNTWIQTRKSNPEIKQYFKGLTQKHELCEDMERVINDSKNYLK